MGTAAVSTPARKNRIWMPSTIVGRLTMRAKQVGALVVGGIVGGVIGSMVRRGRLNGASSSVMLTEAQAEAFVSGLESAQPPTGEERIRRQRELYWKAAKMSRPTKERIVR